jgi:hypothetical protein
MMIYKSTDWIPGRLGLREGKLSVEFSKFICSGEFSEFIPICRELLLMVAKESNNSKNVNIIIMTYALSG